MPTKPIDAVLDHLPKKTPPFAIGLVTILAAIGTVAVTFGLVFHEDIQTYLTWQRDHHVQSDGWALNRHIKDDEQTAKHYDEALEALRSLVGANAAQIVEIAKEAGMAQQQNIILTDRVANLEKQVSELRINLRDCEGKLSECLKR